MEGQEERVEYLGDGCYASFDGYQVWLAVNHHKNKVVALEPSVASALVRFMDNVYKKNVNA